MILIAYFDSTAHIDTPRWHRPMPYGPQFWAVKLWALGANGEKHESLTHVKGKCEFAELRKQHVEKSIDEMRNDCGGVIRFKFWIWKAR